MAGRVSARIAPAPLEESIREDDPPLSDLPIEPNVGIDVAAHTWQNDPDAQIVAVLPCVVEGPPHVIKFLEAETGSSDFSGYLSPPNKITIRGERARIAGIPSNAAFFSFFYPLESLSGQYQRLASADEQPEPWLCFLLIGGYCYFDADRQLIQTNAFVLHQTERKLTLAGPFRPSPTAVAALRAASRLRELTLAPLREQGFERWAWVNPGERPGGHSLLEDGGELPSNGAFMFEAADGEAVLYSLINRALFGVGSEHTSTTTLLNLHSNQLQQQPAESGDANAANLLLDKWRARMGTKTAGHGRSAQQRRRDAEANSAAGAEMHQDSPQEIAAWVGFLPPMVLQQLAASKHLDVASAELLPPQVLSSAELDSLSSRVILT